MEDYRKVVKSFYTKQYALLKYFALWELSRNVSPRLRLWYNIYFWYFLIFWMLLFDWALIMQIFTNLDNMDEVIKVFFILATAIAVMGKFLTIKTKNISYEEVFQLMFHHKFLPENPNERKIFQKAVRLSLQVRNFYAVLSLAALSAFMIQYLIATDELPVAIYNPIDLNTNWKYNLMYLYQCVSLSVMCSVNVAFDSLSASFFIHLKGQLDILGYRLENIGTNLNNSQDLILQQLKDCIRYYNRILLLTKNIEELVYIPISLQIACSIFVLIANFYAMSLLSDPEELANFIKFVIYQTCMLTQIFIMCHFSNEVSLKSSELSFNLYMSDWYNWNKENRKMVLLMMIRFETPIRIKTINSCYSLNLQLYTSIVNSSYSYYALLKRING